MPQQTTTAVTIVGVFDEYERAEQVARELTERGIPRDSIQVQSNFRTGAAGRTDYSESPSDKGGVAGFFSRLFGTDDYAGSYAEAVRRGSTVVTVTVPSDQADTVADVMDDNGAVDIDRRAASYRESGYNPSGAPYTHEQAQMERERYRENEDRVPTSIPVVEEEMRVGKRVVRRGSVRIHSHVIEKPVDEEITLREEKVSVERRTVDRPLEPGEASRLRDQTIEVAEMAEEPVVQKRARVREEVVVDKKATERTARISDRVRSTEVHVDRADGDTAADDYAADFRRDWETNYAKTGESWETYRPAYEYGYRMASDDRYRGREWSEVESDLRSDYSTRYPDSAWERMKAAVRRGWDKVTGSR